MAATATEVLETFGALVTRLRWPDAVMADFTAYTMNDSMRRNKKRAQFYPVMAKMGFTEKHGAEFAGFLGTKLTAAPLYQVTADMCQVIETMFARTMAEQGDTAIIHAADLPGESGFAWLDQPLELDSDYDAHASEVVVQAISWATQVTRTGDGSLPCIRITLWMASSTEPERDADGVMRDAATMLGPVHMLFTDAYPLNEPLSGYIGDLPAPRTAVAVVAYLRMLWMMLQMEITIVQRAPIGRGIRRAVQRSPAQQGNVQVVTLRRATHGDLAEDTSGGHRDIDWTHRWLVQSHYRHFVAPADRHHGIPAGPGQNPLCAVCSGKLMYVAPYIKGPEGAAFRVRPKVHRLSR